MPSASPRLSAPTSDHPGTRSRTEFTPIRRWRTRALGVAMLGGAMVVPLGFAAPATASPAAKTVRSTATTTKVVARLTEYKIALSRTRLTPGRYTFVVENKGHTVHALAINGPGVRDKRTPGFLRPGRSTDLIVVLRDGRYDVFCPVPGHKQLGMNLELTVAGKAAHTTSATVR